MKRFLVCSPDYFKIQYVINPWMDIENDTVPDRSHDQWKTLIRVMEKEIGIRLEYIEPIPDLPDMVFTANAGVVSNGKAILARFHHPERQGEESHFEKWFEQIGYEVIKLDPNMYFEGAGDLLGFPDVMFGGYGKRSDIRVYSHLTKILDKEIIPVELISNKFYHLDTCFCPLSGGEVLYYPDAFDSYAQKAIDSRIEESRRLVVERAEAELFACNAVCIDRHVILPKGCPGAVKLLEGRGYQAHSMDLSEFMKAGGSAKCLTLALE